MKNLKVGRLAVTLGISVTAAIVSFALLEVNPMPLVLLLALAVTLVNYFLGEMVIRRHLASFITSVLKALMAVAIAWVLGTFLFPGFTLTPSSQLVFGAIIGGLEMIF